MHYTLCISHKPKNLFGMALMHKGREVAQVWIGGRAVSAVWHMGRLIWEGVKSCFGSGIWRYDKPWTGSDGWKSQR